MSDYESDYDYDRCVFCDSESDPYLDSTLPICEKCHTSRLSMCTGCGCDCYEVDGGLCSVCIITDADFNFNY